MCCEGRGWVEEGGSEEVSEGVSDEGREWLSEDGSVSGSMKRPFLRDVTHGSSVQYESSSM